MLRFGIQVATPASAGRYQPAGGATSWSVRGRERAFLSAPLPSALAHPPERKLVAVTEPWAKKVVVVGQGYVGLPISIRAAEVGYRVVGIDTDDDRTKRLMSGSSYIEDVSDAQLLAVLATGRYTASSTYDEVDGFDYAVITVPTPLLEGLPDLSFIEQSATDLAPHIRHGATVVLESTTYPGTTEELLLPTLETGSGLKAGEDFLVGYSPERIDPGNVRYNLVNTPKVVAGVDAASLEQVERLYRSLVDNVVVVSSCKVAELTKLLENTFRHVNIALMNELAMFAHDLGVDIWEAIDASTSKPFGYMRFTPGPGVGGHCLPVDPSYLSWQVKRTLGMPFRFIELANDVNDHMPDYVTRRVVSILNDVSKPVRGSRILLIGMAYKKNTSDVRESPAVRVAELLCGLGADVHYTDPYLMDRQLSGQRSLLDATWVALTPLEVDAADLVIVLTDHDDVDYELIGNATIVFDCRNRLAPAANVLRL